MHKAPVLLLSACLALATSAASAQSDDNNWHADWTVLPVSQSGAWGVGTATSISPAIALTVKDRRHAVAVDANGRTHGDIRSARGECPKHGEFHAGTCRLNLLPATQPQGELS